MGFPVHGPPQIKARLGIIRVIGALDHKPQPQRLARLVLGERMRRPMVVL